MLNFTKGFTINKVRSETTFLFFPQVLESHLEVSDRNCCFAHFMDNQCDRPPNSQSIVQIPASSAPSNTVSDGDTCNWIHSVKQRNRGLVQKNETIIHDGYSPCGTFRQTHIYSEKQSEGEYAGAVLQKCFIEFVRLLPSQWANPFLYLLYPSHTHTNTHKQPQNDGFLPAPGGSLDLCTRLNLTLMTNSDRGRKYSGRGG